MDVVHQLAADGAAAGTVVVAREQSGGRGSRGRSWASPAGGLWMSLLSRPRDEPALELLSLRVGLELAVALEALLPGLQVGLKWPNDLLLGDRKLGGVLCEARWQAGLPSWVVIGIGLNVANPVPASLEDGAATLADRAPGISPGGLEQPLIEAALEATRRAGPLSGDELAEYSRRDWLRGRPLHAPARGRADGITRTGALRVLDPAGGVVEVRAGTVRLAPP